MDMLMRRSEHPGFKLLPDMRRAPAKLIIHRDTNEDRIFSLNKAGGYTVFFSVSSAPQGAMV